MKMKQRVLAMILTVMMVITFMPTLAFAGEPEADESTYPVVTEEVKEDAEEKADTQEVTESENTLPQETPEKENPKDIAKEKVETQEVTEPENTLPQETPKKEDPKDTAEEGSVARPDEGVKGDGTDDEECPHINTYTYSELDWDTATYKGIDNRYHNVTHSEYEYTYCNDCGSIVNKAFVEDHTETQMHSYNDKGICEACGHENTCSHNHTYKSWLDFDYQTDLKYEAIDNQFHSVTGNGYERTVCDDCGFTVEEEYVEDHTENQCHIYDEGICVYCGHNNTCSHDNTYTYFEFNWKDYEDIDDQIHSVTGNGYEYTYCYDCGIKLSEEYVENHTETQDHEYNDEGVCVYCDHKNPCKHDHTYTEFNFDWDTIKYEAIDNDNHYHSVIGNGYEYTYCYDCGSRFNENYVEDHTETQSHTYNEEGVCETCGYENTCTHNHTYKWFYFDDQADLKYTAIDNHYHSATGSGYEYTDCSDCGSRVSEEYIEDHTETQSHIYNEEGVCEACSHKNACIHNHTYTGFNFDYQAGLKYEAIDNDNHYHSVTGSGYEFTDCFDCGSRLNENYVENHTETQSHTYNEEGVCEACGYNNACIHNNTYTSFNFDYQADLVYEAIDKRNHSVTGSGYYNTQCMDCGMMVKQERVDSYTMQMPHFYDDGDTICKNCGYENTCTHSRTGSWFNFMDFDNIKYTSIDNKYHNATGSGYKYTFCKDCNNRISQEYVESYTEKLWHRYIDGICEDCGHKNTCRHSNTESSFEFDNNAEYKGIDNKYHQVTGNGNTITECDDCGELINIVPFYNHTERQGHDYDYDGVCVYCNHENTCNHKNTFKWFEFDDDEEYKAINNRYHQAIGNGVEYIGCKDCDMTIDWEEIDNHTEKREHEYNDKGICIDCGYEKPCVSGHRFSAWNTVIAATKSAEGKQMRICSVCGVTETRSIPKLPPSVTPSVTPPVTSSVASTVSSEITDLPSVKISKPKAAKKKITVKWKKVSKKNLKKISGIQIEVATDPAFTNIIKSTTAGKKKTSKVIKGLQPKTKYYVRIRAYAAGNHVSSWRSKSVKVK